MRIELMFMSWGTVTVLNAILTYSYNYRSDISRAVEPCLKHQLLSLGSTEFAYAVILHW